MKYSLLDIQDWVEEYGDTLYRFALSRVYDEVLAEDLVQTTYLAAINGSVKLNSLSFNNCIGAEL